MSVVIGSAALFYSFSISFTFICKCVLTVVMVAVICGTALSPKSSWLESAVGKPIPIRFVQFLSSECPHVRKCCLTELKGIVYISLNSFFF